MTLRTKILPATVAPAALPRAALQRRLDEALQRRLTTVVAGAGFGKSTLLAAWAQRHDVAWYTLGAEDAALSTSAAAWSMRCACACPICPSTWRRRPARRAAPTPAPTRAPRADAFAAALSEALQERLRGPLALVLDDLHALAPEGAAMRAVEALCRQAPEALHVVLAARDRAAVLDRPPARSGPGPRARGRRPRLRRRRGACRARGRARRRRARARRDAAPVTEGWPAAVRLACEAMRALAPAQRGAAVERLRRPGGALFGYLAREVLAQEPPGVRELVRVAAPLERVHPGAVRRARRRGGARCARVARAPRAVRRERSARRLVRAHGPDARRRARLAAAGRRGPARRCTPAPPAGTRRTASPRSPCARGGRSATTPRPRGCWPGTARRSCARGRSRRSSRPATRCPPPTATRGSIAPGRGPPAARRLGRGARRAWAARRAPRARSTPGWRGASASSTTCAGTSTRRSTAYRRGRDDTRAVGRRSRCCTPGTPAPTGCAATPTRAGRSPCAPTRWPWPAARTAPSRRPTPCWPCSRRSRATAPATTRTTCAPSTTPSAPATCCRSSASASTAARATWRRAPTRRRSSSSTSPSASPTSGGFGAFRALALTNRGESRLRLGRLEEAIADLDAARLIYQRLGSDDVAYPLGILGDVYRERGDAALARAAYEEAARRGDAMGDLQALVPSLAGLARVLAGDDPEQAGALAQRAAGYGAGWARPPPCSPSATSRWPRATARARRRRPPRPGRRRAGGAIAPAWPRRSSSRAGRRATERARHGGARAGRRDLARARQPPRRGTRAARPRPALPGERGTAAAREAEARLRELGARPQMRRAATPSPPPRWPSRRSGAFACCATGAPVPRSAWRSRKARDLLKMLVARHGRPVSRDALIEALWPEEDPARCANRCRWP